MSTLEPEEVGALLKEALAAVPVPEDVTTSARAALGISRLDAVLAEILADSAHDVIGAGAVRGPSDTRSLTFRAAALTIEVDVTPATGRLMGQIVPPTAARIVVRRAHSELEVDADASGAFDADGVGPGPLRLRVEVAGGPGSAVETPWVRI